MIEMKSAASCISASSVAAIAQSFFMNIFTVDRAIALNGMFAKCRFGAQNCPTRRAAIRERVMPDTTLALRVPSALSVPTLWQAMSRVRANPVRAMLLAATRARLRRRAELRYFSSAPSGSGPRAPAR
jgi:hypothetical protein